MIARLVFLLVIVFYHTSDAQTPSCPAGFTGDAATGLCYLASRTHSTFDDSVSNCAQFGSRLPSVHNNPVQALLTRVALQVDRNYLWYIGLKRVSGNVFAWIDGTPYNFTSWQANQPASGLGLDCVANFPNTGQVGWRVTPCSDTLPYICVIAAVDTTTTTGTGTQTTTNTQTQTTTTPGNPNTCPPANYQGPTGTITSPGFPAQYGNDLNCQYKITVASGQFVLLTVNSFSTETCCDFLTIYDGPDTSSAQIAQLKGVIPAGRQYEGTTNVLTAIFSSDSSVSSSGFSIQYSQTSATLPPMTTPPMPQCPSVNFTGPSGSIASPGYPGQYANNMNCDYYISVAQNMGVQITFDVFSTEDSYDIVTVYDGSGPLANELDELSGTSGQGKTYTSTVNSMRVNFQSDSSNVDIGFHANYLQVIPPSTIPTTTTTLQPPTTPSARCGRDWYLDSTNNKCYHYDYNKLSFADAQTACRGNNSELISIHSAGQENITASYIVYATTGSERFYTWVGLMAVQGQFTRWTDGTPVDYTAWESGQPSLTIGQCAVIQAWAQEDKASGWRSLDCAYQRPYICQRNPLN